MDSLEYSTSEEIHAFHEGIIADDPDADPGIKSPGSVESALIYISEGYFGQVPETIHEKVAHLVRLIVTSHPYVDGNKRTATNAADTFYAMNGYDFDYDELWEDILVAYASNQEAVRVDAVVQYCRENSSAADEI